MSPRSPRGRPAATKHAIFRFRPKTRAQLRYLEAKLQITRTDVVRLAIARLFEAERRRERAVTG